LASGKYFIVPENLIEGRRIEFPKSERSFFFS